MADATAPRLRSWFAGRGWCPLPFQEACWRAWSAGESGLVHAPTGVGKTLAVAGGPLLSATAALREARASATGHVDGGAGDAPDASEDPEPLRILWVTPLRALARDTVRSLREPVEALGLPWSVELRTGDTPGSRKRRQRTKPPTVMVTTPESLSILLSYRETERAFRDLETVVVDEWHELLGSKRGVQTELGLARLRRWRPELRTWGLSATLGNLGQAMEVLLGEARADGRLIRGPERRAPEVEVVVPDEIGRFPWSGHLGLRALPAVLEAVESAASTLVFTNTRAQAEIWFGAIGEARPRWTDDIALHHGSIDRADRRKAEAGLVDGSLRCVVATSSLDLGVDFPAVDRVVQIGSPKGVGRLLQRAGRSGHTPDGLSRIVCVPTHAWEVAEFHAARVAIEGGRIEPRTPLRLSLDVLVQHIVTLALAGGVDPDEALAEVRTTHAFRALRDEQWAWCLDFVGRGGPALEAYPRYARARPRDGLLRVDDRAIAKRHRMSIGTITSDGQMEVRFLRGKRLGSVEESFLSRLRPGDTFVFAGRRVSLVRTRDMTAFVRLAKGRAKGQVPRWAGGRMPLSSELGGAVLDVLAGWRERGGPDPAPGGSRGPSADGIEPLLEIQARWSRIPEPGRLLVERTTTREGHHLFVFPFLGRFVHDGLAALWAYRLTRDRPRTVHLSANDYGLELLCREPMDVDPSGWAALLDTSALMDDVVASINAAELARRRFRDIARISGLVFPGYPGRDKSARQIQASSGLIYDVLARYDADSLLLDQARREVLEADLQVEQMRAGMERLRGWTVETVETPRLTPLAFPIWAERLQARVSSESWRDRVERMSVRLGKAADRGVGA